MYQGILIIVTADIQNGNISLTSNQTLYIYVGGCPGSFTDSGGCSSVIGGWNGGGNAQTTAGSNACGPGGGGTDIALFGSNNSTKFNTNEHWYSRIIVAGGGGGAGSYNAPNAYGGVGGGINGGACGTRWTLFFLWNSISNCWI